MGFDQSEVHRKGVALALYQIRILLSDYLGSEATGDLSVRQAAHLAYALHSEALALLEGGSLDADAVTRRVTALDGMLGSQFAPLFAQILEPPR